LLTFPASLLLSESRNLKARVGNLNNHRPIWITAGCTASIASDNLPSSGEIASDDQPQLVGASNDDESVVNPSTLAIIADLKFGASSPCRCLAWNQRHTENILISVDKSCCEMPGNNPLLPTSNNPSSRPSRLGARRISPSPATHPSISDDEDDSGLPLTTTTPIGLSEKAKGKRRATGPDQSENASPAGSRSKADKKEEQRGRSITFRFTGEEVRSDGDGEDGGDGSSGGMLSDLDVWVDAGESVGRVKDKVRRQIPHSGSLRPS
jgi:hypothetical protein